MAAYAPNVGARVGGCCVLGSPPHPNYHVGSWPRSELQYRSPPLHRYSSGLIAPAVSVGTLLSLYRSTTSTGRPITTTLAIWRSCASNAIATRRFEAASTGSSMGSRSHCTGTIGWTPSPQRDSEQSV